MALRARNLSRATELGDRLEVADSLWAKFMGLMGRPALDPGAGLWLTGTNGIHMMFMRFPIDAVFLGRPDPARDDAAGRGLGPSRVCGPGPGSCRSCGARTACWSCRSGTIERSGTAVGDLVALEPAATAGRRPRKSG